VRRHGKAVEPYLAPGETEEDTKIFLPDGAKEDVKGPDAENDSNEEGGATSTEETKSLEKTANKPLSEALSEETQAAARLPGDGASIDDSSAMKAASTESQEPIQKEEDTNSGPEAISDKSSADALQNQVGPVGEILHMDPPPDLSIPHLHPPPYVHNFDSYTLVKEVEAGGFTPDQAITAMKAVRVLLADNLDVAKDGLVSKSDVENVS
jgi:hypothetical protein